MINLIIIEKFKMMIYDDVALFKKRKSNQLRSNRSHILNWYEKMIIIFKNDSRVLVGCMYLINYASLSKKKKKKKTQAT